MNNNYLEHHGVKGQRWGVRRYQNEDGSLTSAGKKRAENYSDKQYSRDKSVYGGFAANRINKKMLKGESVSAARSSEADRISNARKRAEVFGNAGKTLGGVGGAVGGFFATQAIMKLGRDHASTVNTIFDDPFVNVAVTAAVSTGMAKAGQQLGKFGGESMAMLMSGYNPSKYRT